MSGAVRAYDDCRRAGGKGAGPPPSDAADDDA
jgi:hypothetical protein